MLISAKYSCFFGFSDSKKGRKNKFIPVGIDSYLGCFMSCVAFQNQKCGVSFNATSLATFYATSHATPYGISCAALYPVLTAIFHTAHNIQNHTLSLYSIFFDIPPNRTPVYTKNPGCFRFIATCLFNCLHQKLFCYLLTKALPAQVHPL